MARVGRRAPGTRRPASVVVDAGDPEHQRGSSGKTIVGLGAGREREGRQERDTLGTAVEAGDPLALRFEEHVPGAQNALLAALELVDGRTPLDAADDRAVVHVQTGGETGLDADAPGLEACDGHRMREHGILHVTRVPARAFGVLGGDRMRRRARRSTVLAPTISPNSFSPVGAKPMRR